ncbi:MFS transporter [Streptomyces flavofungini]|uniref:MFS transporter n=1 Tax=Streptomyces flavofungini TaxID=68200 RepID=UPI0025B2776D|nr:MFS transporter [Streptomyces flavofungini]WJV45159.1 MFS transporter [Streptomyces flavofungini]
MTLGAPVPSSGSSAVPDSAGSESVASASADLWRDRDFRCLWLGQSASQLGEHLSLVVLPLVAVLTLHAGAGELGALRAAGQAPILLFSLLAGAWVDRWRTRTVMVRADAARALALGALAVACLLGGVGLPVLFVVAFAVGTLSVFFDVAYQASLVRLVARDQLVLGNSALEGSRSAAQVGGPALGGALVSVLAAPWGIACGAVFFAVSFVSIRGIRRHEGVPGDAAAAARVPRESGADVSVPEAGVRREPVAEESVPEEGLHVPEAGVQAEPLPEHAERPPRVRHQILDGLRFVVGDAALRAVGLASAAFQFSFAALMTVYLLFLPRELHLSGTAVGLALAAIGPGALLGSLLAARLPRRFGHGTVLVAAAALGDGVLLCVPALHGPAPVTVPVLLAVNFVFGVFGQLVNVTVMAVRQALTPDGMQGRAAATITFVGMGLTPLGSLLGGRLAEVYGLRTGLLVAACGMLLSPVLMGCSPLVRLGRTLPGGR